MRWTKNDSANIGRKVYRFTTAQNVPGGFFEIWAAIPEKGSSEGFLVEDRLTFEKRRHDYKAGTDWPNPWLAWQVEKLAIAGLQRSVYPRRHWQRMRLKTHSKSSTITRQSHEPIMFLPAWLPMDKSAAFWSNVPVR